MATRRERPEGVAGGISSDKLYFKIGEVAEIAGVERHVLRFWEENFRVLRPTRSRSRQRVYRRRDVELVLKIKGLLYDERMTIAGARRCLKEDLEGVTEAAPDAAYQARASALQVQREIGALRDLLDRSANPAVDADPLALIRRRGGVEGVLAAARAEADVSLIGRSRGPKPPKRA